MISLKGVRKSFGPHEVLRDINLKLVKGEMLTLSGSSGCGKTTILNVISGLVKPDSGSAVCSSDRTGYVFQKDILIPWMSALDNIAYVLKHNLSGKKALETASLWLDKLGLYECRNQTPVSMSGGMKKRLNIARAMSIKPDILLLDEPFAFLDDSNVEVVKKIISGLVSRGDSAVVLVTHDIKHTADFGGRTVEIKESPVVIQF